MVDQIIEPILIKENFKLYSKSELILLSNKIELLFQEIQSINLWDREYAEDFESQLKECHSLLINNKTAFDQNIYDSLINDLNISLDIIKNVYNILNSDDETNERMINDSVKMTF